LAQACSTHPVSIDVNAIEFSYPSNDYNSLDGISLSILTGRCTGIIGPNGAGKSTLISALCGLLTPQRGDITYQGEPGVSIETMVKREVALIPQEYAFYPELTIQQNLDFFVALSEPKRSKRQAIVTQVLGQCQLVDVKNKKASKLSGGYKRRLNIAIALSKQPSIIFLDEPTVGIDPISRAQIIELLGQLKSEGKTLIYTSHMLSEVETLCDDVYLLNRGQAIGCSALDGDNSYLTIEFLADVDVATIALLTDNATVDQRGRVEIKIVNDAHFNLLLGRLSQAGDKVKQLHFSKNSLDHLYFSSYQDGAC